MAGTPKNSEMRPAAIRSSSGSTSNLASTMLVPPERNTGSVCRLMPAVWNSGRKLTVLSAPVRPVACCTLMALASAMPTVWITALGRPVVPEV